MDYSTNITSPFTSPTVNTATKDVSLEVSYIITIILNGIACPFTVLMNVLVILAVKRRPTLQSNANILLACLAGTDVLTGLLTQPSFIIWKITQLVGFYIRSGPFRVFGHNVFIRAMSVCSCLHLVLVTCERLIAIKFTMHYHEIVTKQKIKVAVISCWVFVVFCELVKRTKVTAKFPDVLLSVILFLCVIFIATAYLILYLETRRHVNMIKTQQLPQDEVDRFVKENKALKTTVYVIGAVMVCFTPMGYSLLGFLLNWPVIIPSPWIRTFAMLNSLINPLIYCWRQKAMRKFVFRMQGRVVHPGD